MHPNLTQEQLNLLKALQGQTSLASLDDLEDLIAAGLVEATPDQPVTDWRVTPAGRAALERKVFMP